MSCPGFHQRYLLEGKIGEGCFACVYNCRRADGRPEGELAVKITDLRRIKADQHAASDFYSRVKREASLLKVIGDREHCCRFVDSMVDRRFHYLVMEKCSTTMFQALERMPELTERSLAMVVQQMVIAVAEVHALGILHRDIKPDNFLCVGPDTTVKLCDFGFARKIPSGPACVRGVFGTAPFMSPEMVTGLEYATPTDVWSLGVVLYVLLCGEFPYMPEKPCRQRMRLAIARGQPQPSFAPTVAGVWLSTRAVGLLRALLDRDPEMRSSATDVLADPWFSAATEEAPLVELPSLRESLLAAECVGAFGPSCATHGAGVQGGRSMDRTLQELQRKYRLQEVLSSRGGDDDDGGSKKSPKDLEKEAPFCSPKHPDEKVSPRARALQDQASHRFGVMINT
jgi:serine/threonine protein kinase